MAQNTAPNEPRANFVFCNPETGKLTQAGLLYLQQLWRQIAPGFAVVPCEAEGTDEITLTPQLHEEGGATYADGLIFVAAAAATSTGAVTARTGALDYLKVYIDNGATQAGAGDVVLNRIYLFVYHSTLDGGAGGFVRM